jgi:hypothetical protein
MTDDNESMSMDIDTGNSIGGNQSLQLPWVEKYRPKR